MASATHVENLGVTGWFGQTVEKGGSALCATICGCIMIPAAVALVFFGEYNYVKDLNNIYKIKKDIVTVTSYDPANDGLPVAYYGEAIATNFTLEPWKITVPSSFGASYSGQIYRSTVTTETKNNQKITHVTPGWSTTKGQRGTTTDSATGRVVNYNDKEWDAPCMTGDSASASCYGTSTNSNFKVGNFSGQTFLASDYMSRTTSQPLLPSQFYDECDICKNNKWVQCSDYIANSDANTPNRCVSPGSGSAIAGDQYVPFTYYPSNVMVTVCSRQESGATFKVLFSNGNYDIMIAGRKTSDDCIDIMNNEASATVFIFRIIGFACFWCGFVLLLSFVEFIADRIGQLIPCGLGEAFEEMIHCLICMVTCPPATMCWLFWFALAWLIFRPLIGGPLVAVSLCGFGFMYYWKHQNDKKAADAPNNYAPLNNNSGGYNPPQNQQQQYPQMGNPGIQQQQQPYSPQQPAYQPQQQQPYVPQQPYAPNQQQQFQPQPAYQQPNVAPPMYNPQPPMVDANNNGVPDQYETNLPPGYEARMDPNSGRVYWVNHNNNTTTWMDPRGMQPPTVGV